MKAVFPPLPSNHNPPKEPMLRKEYVSFHTLLNAHAIPLTCLGFVLFLMLHKKEIILYSLFSSFFMAFPLKYHKYYFKTIHIDPIHFFSIAEQYSTL